jgi:hypothetical protein
MRRSADESRFESMGGRTRRTHIIIRYESGSDWTSVVSSTVYGTLYTGIIDACLVHDGSLLWTSLLFCCFPFDHGRQIEDWFGTFLLEVSHATACMPPFILNNIGVCRPSTFERVGPDHLRSHAPDSTQSQICFLFRSRWYLLKSSRHDDVWRSIITIPLCVENVLIHNETMRTVGKSLECFTE